MLSALRQLLPGAVKVPAIGDRAARGRFGEREAAKFLRKENGFKTLARNWRSGRDEIDLVMMDGVVLVFVEVRTRAAHAKVGGYHSVTAKKKERLLRGCRAYLSAQRVRPPHFRFDIVEVRLGNEGDFSIHHSANVPLFPKYFK